MVSGMAGFYWSFSPAGSDSATCDGARLRPGDNDFSSIHSKRLAEDHLVKLNSQLITRTGGAPAEQTMQ